MTYWTLLLMFIAKYVAEDCGDDMISTNNTTISNRMRQPIDSGRLKCGENNFISKHTGTILACASLCLLVITILPITVYVINRNRRHEEAEAL
uniref:Col_cuticle_N domain-containing protein n=1 Tax=Rhabditophanes sp. KR3021 TaxID=114890 RepID=A0AC35TWP9_9BILA